MICWNDEPRARDFPNFNRGGLCLVAIAIRVWKPALVEPVKRRIPTQYSVLGTRYSVLGVRTAIIRDRRCSPSALSRSRLGCIGRAVQQRSRQTFEPGQHLLAVLVPIFG